MRVLRSNDSAARNARHCLASRLGGRCGLKSALRAWVAEQTGTPLGYVELIGTAALGYFVFGNFPDLWTWLGAAIIIASGLYIALRERQLRAK